MNKSFLIALSIIFSAQAYAVDSSGNYAVWGSGKKSCFGFQKDVAAGDTTKYKHYMKGFLTAYNIFTDKTYSISGNMDENQILEWLEAYCEDNPMASFETALTNFTFDHYDKRMKTTGRSIGR